MTGPQKTYLKHWTSRGMTGCRSGMYCVVQCNLQPGDWWSSWRWRSFFLWIAVASRFPIQNMLRSKYLSCFSACKHDGCLGPQGSVGLKKISTQLLVPALLLSSYHTLNNWASYVMWESLRCWIFWRASTQAFRCWCGKEWKREWLQILCHGHCSFHGDATCSIRGRHPKGLCFVSLLSSITLELSSG